MEKMGTRSIADLVRIAERIALHAAAPAVPVSARTRAPDQEHT
jgi:hypothetical protein